MTIYIGYALAFTGFFCTASGYICQKYAHMLSDRAKGSSPYHKSKWFYSGLVLLLLGAIFATATFGFAGQSEFAPLGSVTMIITSIMASCILKEQFTKIDFVATALMTVGTATAMLFGENSDKDFNMDDILDLLRRDITYIYTAAVFGSSMIALAFIRTKGRSPTCEMSRVAQNIDATCRSYLCGVLSGYTAYCAKCVVEVIVHSASTGEAGDWARFEVYLFFAGVWVCFYTQLKCLNTGLAKYDAVQIVPMYQSFMMIFSVSSGYVYFDEIAVQTTRSVTVFVVGVCVTSIGMLALLLKQQEQTTDAQPTSEITRRSTDVGEVDEDAVASPLTESDCDGTEGLIVEVNELQASNEKGSVENLQLQSV